jgi:acyl-CoA synthetase (AMP-forming)/AMP-acid ligase II
MTEMSPLGTISNLKNTQGSLSDEEKMKFKLKQGRVPYGVDMKIVDPETDKELAWDGKTSGDLYVRGPWVVKEYFKLGKSSLVWLVSYWRCC